MEFEEIHEEDKESQEELKRTFLTPALFIKARIKFSGKDLQTLEEMEIMNKKRIHEGKV
jgi:hypothetical protein